MLVGFFQELRAAKVPATLREFLDLLGALEQGLAFADMESFYYLSRTCLVKDEKYFDKYDLAFASYFKGLEALPDILNELIPDEWLRSAFEKSLSDEKKPRSRH